MKCARDQAALTAPGPGGSLGHRYEAWGRILDGLWL